MNLELKKCGDLYVYFDENNNPLYSFEVDYDRISKFHLMCDEMPEQIIIPNIKIKDNDQFQINNTHMMNSLEAWNEDKKRYMMSLSLERYATGAFKICDGCFKGIKKLKLIVPTNYSIMLDWGCFDNNAEIEFVLPNDMTLKQVDRILDTLWGYENENWTLIAHKDFNYESNDCCGISVRDFKTEDARYYNYKISGDKIVGGAIQSKQKRDENKYFRTPFNPQLREYKARNQSQLEEDLGRAL